MISIGCSTKKKTRNSWLRSGRIEGSTVRATRAGSSESAWLSHRPLCRSKRMTSPKIKTQSMEIMPLRKRCMRKVIRSNLPIWKCQFQTKHHRKRFRIHNGRVVWSLTLRLPSWNKRINKDCNKVMKWVVRRNKLSMIMQKFHLKPILLLIKAIVIINSENIRVILPMSLYLISKNNMPQVPQTKGIWQN